VVLGHNPCEACKKTKKYCKNECKTTRLLPENDFAWSLIDQISYGLILRQGTNKFVFWNVNYEAIFGLFDLYDLPNWEKRELLNKITAYATVMIKYEQDKNG